MPSALYEKVLNCPSLPSLPAVAMEVLRITRDPNTRLPEIAKVVQNDPGLSAKILKTVNSSLYGLKERCTRIDRALGFMGMNTVKSIVLGLSLVDGTRSVKGGGGFDLTRFWRKTIYGAAAARHLALETRACDPDEAFTAAMFQDIGMLASVTALGAQYAAIIADGEDPYTICSREKERLEFDHTEIGAELASRWSLPQQYIDSIRHHHAAAGHPGEHQQLVRVVALGGLAADALSGGDTAKAVARLRMYASEWFGLRAEWTEAFLRTVSAAAKELAGVFEKNVGEAPDVGAIMAEVQELSIEHQLAVQREAEALREANVSLERQTVTDALTGIGNRRRFDTEIDAAGENLAKSWLSVLFMDADKFKSVNDTFGHAAGDAVLVELARRLTHAIGKRGLVCRFGGEEFAALAPGCDAESAEGLAEELRRAVADRAFDLSGVEGAPAALPVTISVGAASRPPRGTAGPMAGVSIEQLVKAADEAVYAAKQAGRNCVRCAGQSVSAGVSPAAAAAAPQAAGAPRTMRIMLVEDDPLAAALLKAVLAKQAGVEIALLERGDAALKMVQKSLASGQAIDLMICDLDVPGMGAMDMMKALAADARAAKIPVVVISATEDPATGEKCIAAGAVQFVSKSSFARDLANSVRRILEAGSEKRAAA